jgi:hypothetical protein
LEEEIKIKLKIKGVARSWKKTAEGREIGQEKIDK